MSTGFGDLPATKTPCEVCLVGKHASNPFKCAKKKTKHPLELLYMDLCGKMEEKSIGGSNYFLTIVDDFTRYTQVYFLCSKDEVYDRISEFITQAERETGLKLKAIRSDNGTEFVNQRVEKLLKSKGIKHQRSVVMVPQQNGVVERAQRFIAERARCTLADAGLPKCYWAEAVSTAVYLNNRSPTKSVKNMMPIEAWTGEKPDLSHLRIFGCEVMVKIPSKKRPKYETLVKSLIVQMVLLSV
ncbi:Hydra magnipapillata [Nesidiocoris tenuis]|uniref:Hydra magnipapillata n=1 Tax=Nesidiocoris tenuis TaxID=355587 RepID=A0ABN7A645_9HEMI|nr:Hydra magnipapillata [Nesidiocoris tenuis]